MTACDAPGIAAISHHSAAYLYGLLDAEPQLIHVITVRGAHPAPPHDVIPHHTRALGADEIVTIGRYDPSLGTCGRLPITTPATTVVMLAAYLETQGLMEMVARAIDTRCTLGALQAIAVQRRRRGRCGPQRVLDAIGTLAATTGQLVSA